MNHRVLGLTLGITGFVAQAGAAVLFWRGASVEGFLALLGLGLLLEFGGWAIADVT